MAVAISRTVPLFSLTPTMVEEKVGSEMSLAHRGNRAVVPPEAPALSKGNVRALIAGKIGDLGGVNWESAVQLWGQGC